MVSTVSAPHHPRAYDNFQHIMGSDNLYDEPLALPIKYKYPTRVSSSYFDDRRKRGVNKNIMRWVKNTHTCISHSIIMKSSWYNILSAIRCQTEASPLNLDSMWRIDLYCDKFFAFTKTLKIYWPFLLAFHFDNNNTPFRLEFSLLLWIHSDIIFQLHICLHNQFQIQFNEKCNCKAWKHCYGRHYTNQREITYCILYWKCITHKLVIFIHWLDKQRKVTLTVWLIAISKGEH